MGVPRASLFALALDLKPCDQIETGLRGLTRDFVLPALVDNTSHTEDDIAAFAQSHSFLDEPGAHRPPN